MEVGGVEDKEIGRPSSLAYNGDSPSRRERTSTHHHRQTINQAQPPLDLSSPRLMVVTAATTTPSATGSIIRSPTASSSTTIVRYRECQKNHAASMGGHVVDGCGEFMPGGEGGGTTESLKCAACECHRNFHRKEVNGESSSTQHLTTNCYFPYNPQTYKHNDNQRDSTTMAAPPPQLSNFAPQQASHHQNQHHHRLPIAPVMMAFGGSGAAESSSEDLNMFQSGGQTLMRQAKKRFRTKFSQEQKDKMTEFADKLGWKIQRQDDQEVQEFCSQVGVKRQVFKVWMHNNKQSMKKNTSVKE